MQDTREQNPFQNIFSSLTIPHKNLSITNHIANTLRNALQQECIEAIISHSSPKGDEIYIKEAKNSISCLEGKWETIKSSLLNITDTTMLNRVEIWLTNDKSLVLKSNFISLCHLILDQSTQCITSKKKSKDAQTKTKRALALQYIQFLDNELVLKNLCINILAPDSYSTNLHLILSFDEFYDGVYRSDFNRLTLTQFHDVMLEKCDETYMDGDIQQSCALLFQRHKYLFCSSVISQTLFNTTLSSLLDIAHKNQTNFSLSAKIKSAIPQCKELLESTELLIIEEYQRKLSCRLIEWYSQDYKKQNTLNHLLSKISKSKSIILCEEIDQLQVELSSSTLMRVSNNSSSSSPEQNDRARKSDFTKKHKNQSEQKNKDSSAGTDSTSDDKSPISIRSRLKASSGHISDIIPKKHKSKLKLSNTEDAKLAPPLTLSSIAEIQTSAGVQYTPDSNTVQSNIDFAKSSCGVAHLDLSNLHNSSLQPLILAPRDVISQAQNTTYVNSLKDEEKSSHSL